MSMTQGEAVFQAFTQVVGAKRIEDCHVEGIGIQVSEQELGEVYSAVLASFKAGSWTKNSGGQDDAALKKYIPGLVNNWMRKDKRLNGGGKYETKRPGSRSGTGDESVKAMRALLAMTTDPTAKQTIQAALDQRLAELKPKPEINVAALPESLRNLVPQS